jgi:hypothetical protein
MSKFKVGDRVRINSETDPSENGKIAVVTETDRKAKLGTAWDYQVESPEMEGGYNIYNEEELEAISETPKVGSKFYVARAISTRAFDTIEEATAYAKEMAEEDPGYTWAISQPLKAFKVNEEAQEVTLA